MRHLFAALACIVALGGCATTMGPAPNPEEYAISAGVRAGQALFVAEAAFDAASVAAGRAALEGVLKGDDARAVLEGLDAAHNVLLVARAAYAQGDMITTTAQAALAGVAVGRVHGMIGSVDERP